MNHNYKSTETYKNRHGNRYYFVSEADNRYSLRGDLDYYRYGGKEGQEKLDMNDLGFVDPSGGPFLSTDIMIDGNEVEKICIRGNRITFITK